MLLRVARGDISKMAVDAIVNASNPTLDGYGGVDGCIRRAAGPVFHQHCRSVAPIDPGKVIAVPGYELPATYVINTVAPKCNDENWETILVQCYVSCFQEAKALGVETLAFPMLGTGAYSLPSAQAAGIAVGAIVNMAQSPGSLREVILVAHDDQMEHHLKVAVFGDPKPSCDSKMCPACHDCAQFFPLATARSKPLNDHSKEGRCWAWMPTEMELT